MGVHRNLRFLNLSSVIQLNNKNLKIGPSHLLSEYGDLSFLMRFSKQCLIENIQGKFQKNSLVTLISEESPKCLIGRLQVKHPALAERLLFSVHALIIIW